MLCVRPYKKRPKRKGTCILSSEQEMKAGFMVMTQEQSNCHPSGREIPLPSKRVEADEVRLQECVVCFLEVRRFFRRSFSSVPACESTVLHRSMKGFYGSCWEKMPDKERTQDWLLHHDNMPCHMDSQLFLVPNQEQDGGGIWPLCFSILVFMAYSGSQR